MSDYTTLLTPGTRIRNHGEQFPRAFREGTATIIECTQHYRDGTHEYLVRRARGEAMSGYTLSEIQAMRERMEMQWRLYDVEREHKMRALLGDDVYEFVRDPVARERVLARTTAQIESVTQLVDRLLAEPTDTGGVAE